MDLKEQKKQLKKKIKLARKELKEAEKACINAYNKLEKLEIIKEAVSNEYNNQTNTSRDKPSSGSPSG